MLFATYFWLAIQSTNSIPCGYEDASDLKPGNACVWNAGTRGNEIGQSFIAWRMPDQVEATESGPMHITMIYYQYEDGHIETGGWEESE